MPVPCDDFKATMALRNPDMLGNAELNTGRAPPCARARGMREARITLAGW